MPRNKINWKNFLVPAVIVFLLSISYGVQAGKLGWYLDDWIILEAFSQGGAARLGAYTFMVGRPLISPLWLLGFWVCGYSPAAWQVWALSWHAMTAIFLWLGIRKLFPHQALPISLAVLLFTVYPLFDQQASALTFSTHWIAFALWSLSFYLMLLAAETRRYWIVLTLAGLFVFSLQIYAKEFFVGLEILRPFALWWLFRSSPKRMRKTIQHEIPWLIAFVGYLIWRLELMPLPATGDRNSPILLVNLFRQPISTFFNLVSMTVKSMLEGLGGVWYRAIEPSSFTIGANADFLSWVVVISLFVIASILIYRYESRLEKTADSPGWFLPFFGLLFFLSGILPGILKGSYYNLNTTSSDRFALAAMPGAAIIITSIIWYLFRSQRMKILSLCLLIAISTGFQIRLANEYRRSWQKQERLYWQLLWRAPDISENTGILGNGALALGLGNWATSSAINMIYAEYDNPTYVPYWYIDLYRTSIDGNEETLGFSNAHLLFQWHKQNSLVFQFEPDISPCLWILDKDDSSNPALDPFVISALPFSDLTRINVDASATHPIFLGKEPAHTWWCYYYQKGDLATQKGDWETALNLFAESQQHNQKPFQASEYLPFLESAVRLGKWDLAEDMTFHASLLTPSKDQICQTWQKAQFSQSIPSNLKEQLIANYRCDNLR